MAGAGSHLCHVPVSHAPFTTGPLPFFSSSACSNLYLSSPHLVSLLKLLSGRYRRHCYVKQLSRCGHWSEVRRKCSLSLDSECGDEGQGDQPPDADRRKSKDFSGSGRWNKVGRRYWRSRSLRQQVAKHDGNNLNRNGDAFKSTISESSSQHQAWNAQTSSNLLFLKGVLSGASLVFFGPSGAVILKHLLGRLCSSAVFIFGLVRASLIEVPSNSPLARLACLATSLYSNPKPLGLKVTVPNLTKISWTSGQISYMLDVLMERHPVAYVLFQMMACVFLITVGGILFSYHRRRKQTLGDAMWDAWACVCSSGTHLKEKSRPERTIGLMLALGGLLFYSLLTSTLTAQFKSRMEWLREGAHSQVMENGHIVVCGANNHLTTVLRQLNKSQEFAIQDGTAKTRKQTILLLSERPRKDMEKLVANVIKECEQIEVLTRSGSLSSRASFQKVAADKARSVILLSDKDDPYESDADTVLSVLALQPLLDASSVTVVAEVSRASTAELLKALSGLNVRPVQDLSLKLFVQCSRQRGLIDVYRQLLDHSKETLNLHSYPQLTGLPYRELRRGFPEAVVCGLIRSGDVKFHPKDYELLQEEDKVLVISPKNTQKDPSEELISAAEKHRNALKHMVSNRPVRTPVAYDSIVLALPKLRVGRPSKAVSKTAEWASARKERIVLLGWRPGVGKMVLEYDDYVGQGTELVLQPYSYYWACCDFLLQRKVQILERLLVLHNHPSLQNRRKVILAEASLEERELDFQRKVGRPLQNVHVKHKVGNPMSRADLAQAILETSSILADDNAEKVPLSIIVIADRGWQVGDSSRPDKQSVFALLMAESLCKQHNVKVASLVAEFVDTTLGKQVVRSQKSLTYISTTELMGLVTVQVLEEGELNAVWTELLNSWGNEIYVKDIELYQKAAESPSFAELTERASARDEVAIGYRHNNKIVLNPKQKTESLRLEPGDSLVVIAESEYSYIGRE